MNISSSNISIFDLLAQADLVVQIVMFILALASIWSWTIAFDKAFRFFLLKSKTNRFEALFQSQRVIDDIFYNAKKNDDHPFARIFIAAIKEWKNANIKNISQSNLEDKKESLKQRIAGAMQIACNKSIEKLESNMQILAIIGSISPFIGLFGTVWGIMSSFQNIAVSKNTSLAVVAPGIAEALLATAIGLFAAIPAVFFYNIYSNKINQFSEKMDNFSILISNILSRELDN